MKALMTHSENSAVGHYRVWMQAKYLRKAGWDISRLPDDNALIPNDDEVGQSTTDPQLRKNFKKYGSWESLSEGSDIIVFQRPDQLQSLVLSVALRDHVKAPLVFEIDDNIFDVSKSSPSYQYWFPGSPLFEIAELLMRNADALTVSTEALKQVYAPFNDHIYVLPNCQDIDDWKNIVRPKPEKKLVVGWAGGSSHYDDLYMIRRPLKKFLRNYPNAVFRIIGALPDFLKDHPQVEFRKDIVHVSDWPKKLAELNFDIGLAPVVTRPFNEGKSSIKWQEYSMLKIPTIASPITYGEDIVHGATGLLPRDEDQWYYYLCKLVDEPHTRDMLGQLAYNNVVTNYDIKSNIVKWQYAYNDIIDRFDPDNIKEIIPAKAVS